VIGALVRRLDRGTGSAGLLAKGLRYVFPDHWSFLFGEIALYAFVILVATGTYLAFFFDASMAHTVYQGSYEPLRGQRVTEAYRSVIDLSFDVRAGLLIRQVHHWAANVFLAAITIHLLRVFFTGAFRRPRTANYRIGLTLLGVALLEGYMGYSLIDDLLSGMGLAIGYSVALSIPFIGGTIGTLMWGGDFPGSGEWITRFYIGHVFLLPALIATLIAVHLALIARAHHTQLRGPGRTERNVVGSPMWPGYMLRSGGLFLAVAAVLVLLGGLAQINPVWQWGPYEIWRSTNGAQPDWYLGWLIGALRIMPNWELVIGGWHVVPNPFFGGVLFPAIVFGVLWMWPTAERLITGDRREHNLLDQPRDRPWRTALGAAMVSWVALMFLFGAADRLLVQMGISYEVQLIVARVLVFALPAVVFLVVKRACEELRRADPPEPAPAKPAPAQRSTL
jgi:ubiquinol-cytochrome c reductase cytochrome b subunit